MNRFLDCLIAIVLTASSVWLSQAAEAGPADSPRASDPRLKVELFAAAPDIVHPTGIDFDKKGRLLVIESHTHFRPDDYTGPRHDRVRALEDTDGDGEADRFTTFFEGTRATMDIAVHADGSVYLATRNEILRLVDLDDDGKADERRRVVFLDTEGDYPHNGLSGLAFDSRGDLCFGMGENLGAAYRLTGADGATIADGGEGGNVFACTADGKKLRRVATGFWNPFGVCVDVFGRRFAVDNDADAMPPCRLLHVVDGADFGFQFRYGRSGRHPFQAWNGELPGTLPMMCGTGEAPCEVVSYESDGLPPEYIGDLLVTSWADHRVERYANREQGASFVASRQPFVQGGKGFHPVGLAVAPDGSLFVSDWVLSDYKLHQRGAVWHIRLKEPGGAQRPRDPQRALSSAHRPLREAAARRLAAGEAGRDLLRGQLASDNTRVRAASLAALINAGDSTTDLRAIAEADPAVGVRGMAVRALVDRGDDARRFLDSGRAPEVRREAVAGLNRLADVPRLLELLGDPDPFLRNAAVQQLARTPALLDAIDHRAQPDPLRRIGILLAHRAAGRAESSRLVADFQADPDDDVRFLAAKWIADLRLDQHRSLLVDALKDDGLNVRMHSAYATALARVEGRDAGEANMADYFLGRITDDQSPPALRAVALRLVPATHPRLSLDLLAELARHDDPALRLEAVRALSEQAGAGRLPLLLEAASSTRLDDLVRAEAIVGLAESSQDLRDDLVRFARSGNGTLRDEALRALVGSSPTNGQREALETLAERQPETAALVARVLGEPFARDRPPADDLDAWLRLLDGSAAAEAGRRVFFHPRLARCSRCHRVDGRGGDVGPDLSTIGRTERRQILESILQPSNLIAPHYQAWLLQTTDGRVQTGMLVRTALDEYTYLDAQGGLFKLDTVDLAESRPLATSIMPDGLADLLTDQELRDLLAYLSSRR